MAFHGQNFPLGPKLNVMCIFAECHSRYNEYWLSNRRAVLLLAGRLKNLENMYVSLWNHVIFKMEFSDVLLCMK